MAIDSFDSPWLTAAETAAYLKRGRRFIMREIRAGRLRAARIGGRGEVLSCRAWADTWVQDQAAPIAGSYIVMRLAPMIGRPESRRRVSVFSRQTTLAAATRIAQWCTEPAIYRTSYFIVKSGAPAHRTPLSQPSSS